ncbi:leucine-rich repeat-containing protein [Tanacetum coccineum]
MNAISIFFLLFLFSMFASSSSNNIHKCHKKQSEALLLLKHDLSPTSYTSYSYPITMNWNTSTDCCIWNGVTCDRSTGDVIGLDLSGGTLRGTIHPNSSLFNLPRLQTLNLAHNDFDAFEIPSEIGRFSNSLTHLNLSWCGLSGQVPPDITLLHKLVSLDLSSNYDDLKLEPHVFINMFRNFTNLEELSLSEVNISSVLPTRLNISSSLKLLNLFFTGLQGTLPHYIFNLQSLETLDLRFNHFTGDIPSKIPVNLTHLTSMGLSLNNLNGTLPSWLFTSPSLESLYLNGNMFSGNVPFESFALPSLKRCLDLGDNQLSGQIDVQTFRQLTNLTYLDLSSNNFSGEWELDTLLSSLTNLEFLDLSYSGFSVTTKNTNHYVNPGFSYLKLVSCKLKVFPESFRAMKQLHVLDLSGNEIHGQIPHWAGEIGRNELYRLNLSHNFITGLPQFQWYGLSELYLQSNLIEGPFPPSICNMNNLWYLDMSHNSFDGVIQHCVGNISNFLTMMDLGNNSFQGTIPNVFEEFKKLEGLNLNGNRLEGGVPSSLSKCESLKVLDLGNNSFQGTIPNVFEGLVQLEGLILNGNQLEGGVPSSLSKCESLKVLDLGNNHLNGTFPGWLGDLPRLQVLVLKSNNFHGNIQPSFAVKFPFPHLQVLDLSHNCFVGQLPTKYFQNFDSMKNVVKNNTEPQYLYMAGGKYYSFVVALKGVDQDIPRLFVSLTIIDLSNNYFERGIPEIIGNLSALKVLNLSHNSLYGRIPDSLGKLSEIESLDLSSNQLTGNIPQSLAGIKGLEVLNLSQNHLVGHIPEGTQFKTFDESSFAGNLGLCGFPLPKECSERTHKPQLEEHEEKSGFTWEVVTLGYGCGTLLGLVMGYLLLSTRKVKWFNLIADAGEHMILERNKRSCWSEHGESLVDNSTSSHVSNANENNKSYINDKHKNLKEMLHDLKANDGDIDQEDLQQLFEDAEKPVYDVFVEMGEDVLVEQSVSSHPVTSEPVKPKQTQEERVKERLDILCKCPGLMY